MKQSILLILAVFSMSSFAATPEKPDLVDVCGTLTKVSEDAYTLTSDKKETYVLVSSEDMSLKKLAPRIPASNRMCIRAYVYSAEPKKLLLDDFWSYMRREYVANCLVSEVLDDNVFEESLSVDEYPDVDVIDTLDSESEDNPVGLEFSIAMAQSFSEAKGDTIEVTFHRQYRKIVAVSKDRKTSAEIRLNHQRHTIRKGKRVERVRLGELYYNGKPLADLRCK